mgnify:FL=1
MDQETQYQDHSRIDELENLLKEAKRSRFRSYIDAVGGTVLPSSALVGFDVACSYFFDRPISTVAITASFFIYIFVQVPRTGEVLKGAISNIRTASTKIQEYRSDLRSLKGY